MNNMQYNKYKVREDGDGDDEVRIHGEFSKRTYHGGYHGKEG